MVIGIDDIVLVDFGKGIEFKANARMPSPHDLVDGKSILITDMAFHAKLRAFKRFFRRVKAEIKVLLVSDLSRNMRPEVAITATVAGFAAHAVIDIEALAAERYGNVVRMAIKADLGGFRRLWKS